MESFCIYSSEDQLIQQKFEAAEKGELERHFKVAKWRAMLQWPSIDSVWRESQCNIEGVFSSSFEPWTYHEGRCISYDELAEIVFEEEMRLRKERQEQMKRE